MESVTRGAEGKEFVCLMLKAKSSQSCWQLCLGSRDVPAWLLREVLVSLSPTLAPSFPWALLSEEETPQAS